MGAPSKNTKLFIIGNGFDIAHGMKTSYPDFRRFLKENCLNGIDPYDDPEDPYDEDYYDPCGNEDNFDPVKTAAKTIIKLIDSTEGDNWGNIENALGELDFSEFLDPSEFYTENHEFDPQTVSKLVPAFFEEWAEQIKIPNTKTNFINIFNPDNDFVLNFNYTETLETLYNAQNVCHIHGGRGEKFLFGHGNDDDFDDYPSSFIDPDNILNKLKSDLKKDTCLAYTNKREFFQTLKSFGAGNPVDICSVGFSFSNADKFYLQQISKLINTQNSVWFLNTFEDNKIKENYTKTIRNCGFRGVIKEFNFLGTV